MSILTNLFGESPFGALEAHGERVHACVNLLRRAFEQVAAGNQDGLQATFVELSRIESEADKIRDRLHELLVSRVLMPMRRDEFFYVLDHQDSMANRAEEIAGILTYRNMALPPELMDAVAGYVDSVLKNCDLAAGIMSKLDLLVESSFAGRDAETVSRLITELSERDDTSKAAQIELSRRLLAAGDRVPPVEAVLWVRVLELLAQLSSFADRVGSGVRMTLDVRPSKKPPP